MLRAETIPASDIPPEIESAWRRLQATDPLLRVPHLSAGFARSVGRHRPEARIAIIETDGAIAGLFAFHHRKGGAGQPLGGPISDYQAVIMAPETPLSQRDVLAAAGLGAFDFNHGLASQPLFAEAALCAWSSPALDLSRGFEAWRAGRLAAPHPGQAIGIQTVEKRARQMTRALGPIRFVADDRSPEAWARLVQWKRAALQAKGLSGFLERPWEAAVIDELRASRDADCAGLVSTLYAGDHLMAAHFGIRSRTVWHWWFPTYNVEMARYSPGLVLLLEAARSTTEGSVERIDLGRGRDGYKLVFADTRTALCEGALTRPWTPSGAVRRLRRPAHALAMRLLSPRLGDLQRRAVNRLLGAGRI